MGRYYSGDIEGKFWFAVQSSDDAEFFGGSPCEPNYIVYHFDKERDMENVDDGIKTCLEKLGEFKTKLDGFFAEGGRGYRGYNDQMLAEAFQIPANKVRDLLEWYARLELGEKIKNCLQDKGECTFEAEL
jgi:hypothetical protein